VLSVPRKGRYAPTVTKGVFIYRASSEYNDDPTARYQFPTRRYLSRATALINDWVIFLEPRRGGTRGYFAVAKVQSIVPDPTNPDMHLALIETGSFVEFDSHVPFSGHDGPIERGLLNADGEASGNKQAAVRPISDSDFNKIVGRGLSDELDVLPRIGDPQEEIVSDTLFEDRTPYAFEVSRDRVEMVMTRAVRDRAFRRNVLAAYDCRCAFSGLKLINGGGRAEVEAAHIRPVEHGGPDAVANGLALSGTAHWMFDRGLITIEDDLSFTVSRHVNDIESVWGFLQPSRRATLPVNQTSRPHPNFLGWHREHIFKH
jgi:putative restriction endonuclease